MFYANEMPESYDAVSMNEIHEMSLMLIAVEMIKLRF